MEFDAFLLLGFGGPEGPDEVMPFLRNVTRGRDVPDERLHSVAQHYEYFGGVSPINAHNRALLDALEDDFRGRGIDLPVYWGNRNWHPLLPDVVRDMRHDGVRRALVLATSATAGYSSCRQYRENLLDATAEVGDGAPELIKLRHFYNHPGFIEANADRVRVALRAMPDARLVFTAHSVPASADAAAGPSGHAYSVQQRETAQLIAETVRGPGAEFDLVWQSRSGPPRVTWLTPDINDHLTQLAEDGVRDVVIVPSGFVSDHLEVLWDLDVEAAATAQRLGLRMARAATVGTHPRFVAAIGELVLERTAGTARLAVGHHPAADDECPFADGCCLA